MVIFFQVLSRAMYAMKPAKIRKPIRLYMPEQAMSMAYDIVVLSGRIMLIVGVPKLLEIHDRMPRKFAIAFAASVLATLSVEPTVVRVSDGGGVRKAMKAIGKMACRRVCGLNIIRKIPAVKKGRVAMWYCRGVKVCDPYMYNVREIMQSKTPLNVAVCLVLLSCILLSI